MPNFVNKLILKELTGELESAGSMLFVSFCGLSVSETEDLRGKLAEKGVKFRMIKNSLAKRVLSERGLEFADDVLIGNTGLAYGETEAAIHAAQILTEKEVKKAGKVSLKAGLLEGAILGPADSASLADIPDTDTLRAMMLGVISGPARSLVGVLNALPSGVARVLSARVDAGGGAEASQD